MFDLHPTDQVGITAMLWVHCMVGTKRHPPGTREELTQLVPDHIPPTFLTSTLQPTSTAETFAPRICSAAYRTSPSYAAFTERSQLIRPKVSDVWSRAWHLTLTQPESSATGVNRCRTSVPNWNRYPRRPALECRFPAETDLLRTVPAWNDLRRRRHRKRVLFHLDADPSPPYPTNPDTDSMTWRTARNPKRPRHTASSTFDHQLLRRETGTEERLRMTRRASASTGRMNALIAA